MKDATLTMGAQMKNVHYDYDVQAWIEDGIVSDCSHPESMRAQKTGCCNAHVCAGLSVQAALLRKKGIRETANGRGV